MKLAVNDQELTQKLNVLKDPHSTGTEASIAGQMKLLNYLRDDLEGISQSVNQMQMLRSQLVSLNPGLGNAETARPVRSAALESRR